jgi:hypothetical protein
MQGERSVELAGPRGLRDGPRSTAHPQEQGPHQDGFKARVSFEPVASLFTAVELTGRDRAPRPGAAAAAVAAADLQLARALPARADRRLGRRCAGGPPGEARDPGRAAGVGHRGRRGGADRHQLRLHGPPDPGAPGRPGTTAGFLHGAVPVGRCQQVVDATASCAALVRLGRDGRWHPFTLARQEWWPAVGAAESAGTAYQAALRARSLRRA